MERNNADVQPQDLFNETPFLHEEEEEKKASEERPKVNNFYFIDPKEEGMQMMKKVEDPDADEE